MKRKVSVRPLTNKIDYSFDMALIREAFCCRIGQISAQLNEYPSVFTRLLALAERLWFRDSTSIHSLCLKLMHLALAIHIISMAASLMNAWSDPTVIIYITWPAVHSLLYLPLFCARAQISSALIACLFHLLLRSSYGLYAAGRHVLSYSNKRSASSTSHYSDLQDNRVFFQHHSHFLHFFVRLHDARHVSLYVLLIFCCYSTLEFGEYILSIEKRSLD